MAEGRDLPTPPLTGEHSPRPGRSFGAGLLHLAGRGRNQAPALTVRHPGGDQIYGERLNPRRVLGQFVPQPALTDARADLSDDNG